MKLSELIKQLQELAVEHGDDTRVVIQCDHGQTLMSPTHVGKAYVTEESLDQYALEEVHEDDIPYNDCVTVIDIQAY